MNQSWFIFYGRLLHMSRQETLLTPYGEMLDMIACMAIQGGAPAKPEKKEWTMQEVLEMR